MEQAEPDFQSKLRRLEEMLLKVDRFNEKSAQACTREIVQSLLELHGNGLRRMLEHLDEPTMNHLVTDEVVSGLLLLHDLHPLPLEERVRQALISVRPYLSSHGGNVELIDTTDGVILLRLEGSCHGCPSSTITLKQTIETAIWERAPDAISIVVEGEEPAAAIPLNGHSNGHYALPILAV